MGETSHEETRPHDSVVGTPMMTVGGSSAARQNNLWRRFAGAEIC
jgi:hypothetical protein